MIRVRVPATSANLGPGFDCMGLALRLYSNIEIEQTDKATEIIQTGTFSREVRPENNLVYRAMCEVFRASGVAVPELRIKIHTEIPPSRGLGSSAACIVGGMVGANALYGKLGASELLALACRMEGHPDNVVPCMLGGYTVSLYDGKAPQTERIALSDDIRLAVLYPDGGISTKKSRQALPDSVPHRDAAFNTAHGAMVALALSRRHYRSLRSAMEDRLHQPYRKEQIDGMDEAFSRLYDLGAYGCYLSGSGPALAAIIPSEKEDAIAEALTPWCRESAVQFGIYGFDNEGSFVTKTE